MKIPEDMSYFGPKSVSPKMSNGIFFNKMATSVKFSAINLHVSLIFHNYNG